MSATAMWIVLGATSAFCFTLKLLGHLVPEPWLANARLQRFTLEGQHIDFVDGTKMPCHFGFFKNGDVVVPDLGARVTLLDKHNQVIENLGDASETKRRETRTMTRDHFTAWKFVAPHGACFDHEGNIFVVEWVEVGRVTKLRKV